MLSLVITLLIIALIAGILGFGGIAGAAVGIAKIVFVIALVLFVISLLTHGLRGGFSRDSSRPLVSVPLLSLTTKSALISSTDQGGGKWRLPIHSSSGGGEHK